MPMKISGRDLKWVKSAHPDLRIDVLRVEGNSTSTPDGDEPSAISWARTGVGTYTFTYPAADKPRRVVAVLPVIEEDAATLSTKFTGYVASTGVGTVKIYQDGAANQSTTQNFYHLGLRFVGGTDDAPTSPDPTTDITWARTGEGVYTGTFDSSVKPLEIIHGTVNVEGAAAGQRAYVDSYVYATGIMTVKGRTTDLLTADDLTGKTVSIGLLCTDTAIANTVAAQKAAQLGTAAAADINDKTLVLVVIGSNSPLNDA